MSNTTIQLRKSGQTGNTPADLTYGELAINYADGKLFYKNGVGIKSIENQKTFSTINANNSLILATTPTDILNIVPGNNITISSDVISKKITVNFNDNGLSQSAFDSANAGVALATAAYGKANAEGEINTTQNTSITNTNTFAQSAFNSANAGVILANSAYNEANTKVNRSGDTITGNLTVEGQANVYQRFSVGTGSYTILPNLIAQFTGSSDFYSQVNHQNISGNGSGDIVVTTNNGTDDVNYINLGITGNTYNSASYTAIDPIKPNDGYLLLVGNAGQTFGGNLFIGTTGSGDVTENTAIGDIVFVQGEFYDEVGRFILGDGFSVSANLTVQNSVIANNVFSNGTDLYVYINTANTFLQANDAATLTLAKGYTDTANVYLQNLISQSGGDPASNPYVQASFAKANAAFIYASSAYDQANNASGNTVALQAQMTTTNTNIGYTDTLATAAYGEANTQNVINQTQNTWITNTNTLAQSAYDFANTRFSSSGGTISGNVTIQNDLSVLGNVNFIGNVTSITVTGNSGQFFGYASNGHNALYAGIPVGYDFQPFTVFQASANYDGYSQINIQNINNGPDASGDYVATADNGTEDDTYIDMGIGSSQHADPEFTLISFNDGYLYTHGNTTTGGGDLVLGTFLPQNDVIIAAGGMNTENEQMRIIGSSNTISITANVDSSISKSVLLGPVANVHITGGSTGQLLSTDGSGNLSFINSPLDLASAAFDKANGAVQTGFTTISANAISITPSSNADTLTISAGNNITIDANSITKTIVIASTASGGGGDGPIAQAAYDAANAGIDLATAAYAQANNASGNTVALQAQMITTNTNIASVNVFAQAAFDKANGSVQSVSGTSGRISVSPTTGAVVVDLNTVGTILAGTYSYPQLDVDSYGRIVLISNQTPVTSFNGMIGAVTLSSANVTTALGYTPLSTTEGGDINTFAQSAFNTANAGVTLADAAYGKANAEGTINTTQNNWIAWANTFAQSAFNSANAGVTLAGSAFNSANAGVALASAAYAQANNASGNTVAIQAVNNTQNTNITSVNTFTQSAFNSANAGVALATSAYGKANAEGTINTTQNTWITNTDTLARAAFDKANTGGAPTTVGIQTNASYFPIFVDANNATATTETLNSHGNLTYNPSTGTLSATIFNSTSDERQKENIQIITNPLDKINQIRGVSFNYINNGYPGVGVIAQDIEKILPELVSQDELGYKSVAYDGIIGLLIEAIKAQQKMINELEKKINNK